MIPSSYLSLLRRPGFFFFLVTQFLGAMNDNVYRLVVSLILVGESLHGGAVSITAVVFLVPPILFSGYAGYFADKYSKRNVLIITKSFEVLSMLLAYIALGTEYTFLMLFVLFALSTQSTFFSPAKYGIVPELVKHRDLSKANALLEMSTYMAIILGAAFAGLLMQAFGDNPNIMTTIMVGIAVLGVATSFGIGKVTAKDKTRQINLDPIRELQEGIKLLKGHLFLSLVVIGICYFWAMAIVFQLNLLVMASKNLQLDYLAIGLMQTVLGIGIGVGALVAGKLSGERIEYGLIPLGLLGMSLGTIGLYFSADSIFLTYVLIVITSLFTGLYILPLKALQQVLPAPEVKGRLIGTTNVFTNISMIVASLLLLIMQTVFSMGAPIIFLFWGIITLIITALAVYMLPAFFIRLLLWIIMHTLYRVRVFNEQSVPTDGPCLLVCNHVSYIDALVLAAVVPRFIRYLVAQKYYSIKSLNWIIRLANSIPIDNSDEAKVEASLEAARAALSEGHIVCVFAEGRITRTGNLLPFKRGFEKITSGLDVPIIPVHLDKLWDSIFSFRGGKFFWKLPRRVPVDVTVSFGAPMSPSSSAWEVRQAVQELGSEAEFRSQTKNDVLGLRLLQSLRFHQGQFCAADNHGHKENYGNYIAHALWMAQQIRARYADTKTLGVLLPPSVRASIVNVACTLAGKTVVNLPYHDKATKLSSMIKATGINRVITTGTFLDGLGVAESSTFDQIAHWYLPPTQTDIVLARLAALFLPSRWTMKIYGDADQKPSDPVAVLWSFEKDRLNKPVVLSHRSVLTPVGSFRQIFDNLSNADCVAGVLPFYTPLGFLGTLWLPLLDGMAAVYHSRAKTDPKGVGKLIKEYAATIIFDVPYGYELYYQSIRPEDFTYINYAIVGGLPMGEEFDPEFLKQFKERFDIDLLEGYGNSETGPVSMNIPNVRMPGQLQVGFKRGSAGQPLPYVSVKIVDPKTGEPLEQGAIGLLLVKTPFRMIGYLDDPETTAEFFEDGWYKTEDMAMIDDEGFLFFPHSE